MKFDKPLEILARYGAKSLDDLEAKIAEGDVAEHPAWEDLLVAENLNARLGELDGYLRHVSPNPASFPHHFHDGAENATIASHLSLDPENALRQILTFVCEKLLNETSSDDSLEIYLGRIAPAHSKPVALPEFHQNHNNEFGMERISFFLNSLLSLCCPNSPGETTIVPYRLQVR